MRYTLSHADEKRLARAIHGSDQAAAVAARNQLVLANLGLVHIISDRLTNLCYRSDYDDAVSEGTLALFRAAELYDPDRSDVRFGSYARVAIHRAMRRYLLDFYRVPCVELDDVVGDVPPVDAAILHNEQVARLGKRLEKLLPIQLYILAQRVELSDGKGRTFAAIAEELELPPQRVWYLYRCARDKLKDPA